jgi:hypothetical protein
MAPTTHSAVTASCAPRALHLGDRGVAEEGRHVELDIDHAARNVRLATEVTRVHDLDPRIRQTRHGISHPVGGHPHQHTHNGTQENAVLDS